MAQELETEAEYIQLSDACDFLEHYHLEHTDDKITRFRGKSATGRTADIYVVADPEWKQRFRELCKEEFPESPPRKGKVHHRRKNTLM